MRAKLYFFIFIIDCMFIIYCITPNFFNAFADVIDCNWSQYMHDTQRTGYSPCKAPDKPIILWIKEFDGGIETSPIISEDKIFIIPSYYGIHRPDESFLYSYILSIYTGEVISKIKAEDSWLPVNPVIVGEDIFYINTYNNDSFLFTYNIITKKERKISGNSVYSFILTIDSNRIFLASKQLVVLNVTSGEILLNLNEINKKNYNSRGGFTIGNSKTFINIITPKNTGNLVCFDINTGKELWRFDPSISTLGNIVYDNGRIFFTGDKLYSADANNGKIIWELKNDNGFFNTSLAYDRIYVSNLENGKVFAIDKITGNIIWESEKEIGWGDTFTIIADKKVFAINYFGKMIVLDADNGNILWNYDFNAEVHSPPAVANGILFVGAGTRLYAFSTDPDVYLKQGDEFFQKREYQKTLDSYQKAKDLYVKTNNLKGIKKIEEMEKRVKMIERVEFLKENRTGILLIGSIIIVVIIYALYRKFKAKNQ